MRIVPINGQGYHIYLESRIMTFCNSSFQPVEQFVWGIVPIDGQGYHIYLESRIMIFCHSSFQPVERFVWGIVPINGQGYHNNWRLSDLPKSFMVIIPVIGYDSSKENHG